MLACVRAREDAVTSLRARFTSTMRRDGESHASTGVLLVSKPERFRLRLMLPFGLTVFDCVKDGEEVHTTLPLQGGGDPASLPLPQLDLEEAFLRGAYAFPGRCEASRAPEGLTVVSCGGVDERQRLLRLDPATATIVDETSYENGEPRMVLHYGDYRLVPGTTAVMPYQIHLEQPARRITLDIAIERYDLNPTLAAALFRPPS